MKNVKLKICGMKEIENIKEISALNPDYLGFIFWEKSKRNMTLDSIPELLETTKKVGVFVNQSTEVILAKAQKYDLQAIQLHGQESVAFCTELKNSLLKDVEIIKVFSILDTFDFEVLKPFEAVCDYFLFDTKGKLPGGNGTTFDWKVLEKYPSSKPFFLSGGIGLEEIDLTKEILTTNLPIHALDLNSKFESEPGLKDKTILKKFQLNLKL